jgi:hypothetical protein
MWCNCHPTSTPVLVNAAGFTLTEELSAGLTTTCSGQVPDVSIAATDIASGQGSVLQLTKQLDSFRKKHLFLGRFRMLGRTERRHGGAQACCFSNMFGYTNVHAQPHLIQRKSTMTKFADIKALAWYTGQAIVQFAQGVQDNRAYAVKFFLDEDSFYAEAAMYVAVFPHLRPWLSERAMEALAAITALPEDQCGGEREAAKTMQAAGARFLPQVPDSS